MDPWNEPFLSYDKCDEFIADLRRLGYTRTALYALETVARLENHIKRRQLIRINNYLSNWRNLTSCYNYEDRYFQVIARNLEVFRTFKVPLFIDNYGHKCLLQEFNGRERIDVNFVNDCLLHVTHKEEAEKIQLQKKLQPSNNKNILEGTWFGLGKKGEITESVYGSYCFSTTLRKIEESMDPRDGFNNRRTRLVLRQGEIVSYKNEVNVILYLDCGGAEEELWKPTVESARELLETNNAYIHLSVFIPSNLLSSVTPENFDELFEFSRIPHSTFCVRNKRTGYECKEMGEPNSGPKAPKLLKLDDAPNAFLNSDTSSLPHQNITHPISTNTHLSANAAYTSDYY